MRKLQDRVAVVTGAASGIGLALCQRLAQQGCHLALVDLNQTGLAENAAQIAAQGKRVSIHVIDVSDKTVMERLPDVVLSEHGEVHILVNNAGVSLAGPFETLGLEDLEWIFGINFWGAVYGCKFFLPHLRCSEEAHIVNVSSTFGLFGLSTKTGYCATKFALRGFSEALRAELSDTRIGLTCVYPGAVDTNLVRGGRTWDTEKQKMEAQFVASRSIPVDKVAARIVRGIERNSPRVLIGSDAWLIDVMTRFSPTLMAALGARSQKRVPFLKQHD
ncbi:MAG: SDR family oxidoreductase [Acidobacteria bacterium]|nr:SDR family oxidoreductase [Acidobacteriota bacterium]